MLPSNGNNINSILDGQRRRDSGGNHLPKTAAPPLLNSPPPHYPSPYYLPPMHPQQHQHHQQPFYPLPHPPYYTTPILPPISSYPPIPPYHPHYHNPYAYPAAPPPDALQRTLEQVLPTLLWTQTKYHRAAQWAPTVLFELLDETVRETIYEILFEVYEGPNGLAKEIHPQTYLSIGISDYSQTLINDVVTSEIRDLTRTLIQEEINTYLTHHKSVKTIQDKLKVHQFIAEFACEEFVIELTKEVVGEVLNQTLSDHLTERRAEEVFESLLQDIVKDQVLISYVAYTGGKLPPELDPTKPESIAKPEDDFLPPSASEMEIMEMETNLTNKLLDQLILQSLLQVYVNPPTSSNSSSSDAPPPSTHPHQS